VTSRSRRRLLLGMMLAVSVVVIGNVAAYAHNPELDLSSADSFTLSSQTTALLGHVRHPLQITAFLTATGPAASDASYLLARYHELNHYVSWSVVDPDANPGEARRYGISAYSTVVLSYQSRRVTSPDVQEGDISTAILRLLRGRTETVCVLTGDGEPSLSDSGPNGLSDVSALLSQNAFESRPVDLSLGVAAVPSECSAVLEMGPQQPLPTPEVSALESYLRGGGRMMVLTSSLSNADPNPLLQPWGVGFLGGLVLDPARSQGVDWSDVVVQDLPSLSPVDQGVSSLQFPAPSGLLVNPTQGTASALAATSSQSYIDPNPQSGSVAFSPGDVPGPIVVAAAVDVSRVVTSGAAAGPGVSPTHVERTRLVVVGCDTWMTNGFLNNLGNRRFFANAVAWLTDQDALVVATSHAPGDRPLPLTPALQFELLGITVGAVPGSMISLALLRSALIRRRENRDAARRARRRPVRRRRRPG